MHRLQCEGDYRRFGFLSEAPGYRLLVSSVTSLYISLLDDELYPVKTDTHVFQVDLKPRLF
jgi:hypothetical protein